MMILHTHELTQESRRILPPFPDREAALEALGTPRVHAASGYPTQGDQQDLRIGDFVRHHMRHGGFHAKEEIPRLVVKGTCIHWSKRSTAVENRVMDASTKSIKITCPTNNIEGSKNIFASMFDSHPASLLWRRAVRMCHISEPCGVSDLAALRQKVSSCRSRAQRVEFHELLGHGSPDCWPGGPRSGPSCPTRELFLAYPPSRELDQSTASLISTWTSRPVMISGVPPIAAGHRAKRLEQPTVLGPLPESSEHLKSQRLHL